MAVEHLVNINIFGLVLCASATQHACYNFFSKSRFTAPLRTAEKHYLHLPDYLHEHTPMLKYLSPNIFFNWMRDAWYKTDLLFSTFRSHFQNTLEWTGQSLVCRTGLHSDLVVW